MKKLITGKIPEKKEDKHMTLKQGRWVKIHEQGQANFESEENVMDITVGSSRCQAEATYTASTRTYQKAAYWMLRYLGHANAEQILALAAEEIIAKAAATNRDEDELTVEGDGWSCVIEKMDTGVFRVQLNWKVDETPAVETKKKRSRKKTGVATDTAIATA